MLLKERYPWSLWVGRVLRVVLPLGFVLGATSGASRWQPGGPQLTSSGVLWLVAIAVPLLIVHRFPMTIFLLTSALTLGYYTSGNPGGPAIVLPTIALFLLTKIRGPIVAGGAGGALLAASGIALFARHGLAGFDLRAGLGLVWVIAVVGIGTAVRNGMAAARARREQADEHRHRMAEQERLTIAREVHDVVAHSLAMINVQAGVAAHVADRRPEQAKEALLNIKEASASALKDLRATLAVLRSGEDKAPAPSLAQADELFEHARAAGLEVRVDGEPGELPAPVDGAAYRILQESLTNVVRHANQARGVDVRFERKTGALTLLVRDDGHGAVEPAPGHGLRGMSERAAALGGALTTSVVNGGFQVRVDLPIKGEE
ncbi:sensor histidine kinase [Amycolatopsis sp. EV170708-02-1]|uniref:sensor histidine kinase n=1 Tax=Amycolatopsis sp. EV170708-02-1 TaxID=2919322 RepID=UPI001F0BC14D|nr:sensor histidine kinase [Amycolatopsis sp. EV170708-02-1]UMP02716.1 sensor histidine kinase [Amycolatopsis sp. EV170708-02-1]